MPRSRQRTRFRIEETATSNGLCTDEANSKCQLSSQSKYPYSKHELRIESNSCTPCGSSLSKLPPIQGGESRTQLVSCLGRSSSPFSLSCISGDFRENESPPTLASQLEGVYARTPLPEPRTRSRLEKRWRNSQALRSMQFQRSKQSIFQGMDALELPTQNLLKNIVTKVDGVFEDEQSKVKVLEYLSSLIAPVHAFGVGPRIEHLTTSQKFRGLVLRSKVQLVLESPLGFHCEREKEALEFYRSAENSWNLDLFELDEILGGKTLIFVLKQAAEEMGFDQLPMNRNTYMKLACLLHANYLPNPYHNQLHAADVAYSITKMLRTPSLEWFVSPLERLALLIAAAAHDLAHPGVSGEFLINISHPLAVTYNDSSVLENFHCASLFTLIGTPEFNILENFSNEERKQFRRMVIKSIMWTDMVRHANVFNHFQRAVRSFTESRQGSSQLMKETMLDALVHCADIASPTKSLKLYHQWTTRVMEEFFKQGEQEAKLGLPISPMCDRNTVVLEKAQTGYIDIFVEPLWKQFAALVRPDFDFVLAEIRYNRDWYASRTNSSKRRKTRKW